MMPLLDVQVALDDRVLITYEFFEKPTKYPLTILATGQFSYQLVNKAHTRGPEKNEEHFTEFGT